MHSGVFLQDGDCRRRCLLLVVFSVIFPLFGLTAVMTAEAGHGFDGIRFGPARIVPIVAILLSTALFPLLSANFRCNHSGKVSFFRTIAFLIPFAIAFGVSTSVDDRLHTLFLKHIWFVILVCAVPISTSFGFGSLHARNFEVRAASILRNVIMAGPAIIALATRPNSTREANRFNRKPVPGIAMLSGYVIITIIPAVTILWAAEPGITAPLLQLVTNADGSINSVTYFWLTGILPRFPDNAATYHIFFNSAGGDFSVLQGNLAYTLLAISAGAVFMGASIFIGNASNIMVKSIAERYGIAMAGFLGYPGWLILFPLSLFGLFT